MKYYLINALILSVFLLNNNIISLFFILLMFAIVSVLYGEEKTSIPKLLVLFSISAAFILNIFVTTFNWYFNSRNNSKISVFYKILVPIEILSTHGL